MPIDMLIENISRHIILNDEEKALFISMLSVKSYKKKHILTQENEISTLVTFVCSGCLKAYTIDDNGFEHILQFAPPDWWVTDMYSFITQKPGDIFIEVIDDCTVVQLSRSNQLLLFDKIPKFERYFRILTENSLVSFRKRLVDNLSLTALDRYNDFCIRYPTLVECIPQKLIASYIGVTPEFLSKMRNRKNNL